VTAPAEAVVQEITIPVTEAAFLMIKATVAAHPADPVRHHVMTLSGVRVRGVWIVIALRSDYALGNQRTHWVTLRWVGES
jgi:hypothetical protein